MCRQNIKAFVSVSLISKYYMFRQTLIPHSTQRCPNRTKHTQIKRERDGNVIPCEGAAELDDVLIAEDTPNTVLRLLLRPQKARVFEEESDVGYFGPESIEESGEEFFVAGEVLVTRAMVVMESAHFAELEFVLLLLLLFHWILRLTQKQEKKNIILPLLGQQN